MQRAGATSALPFSGLDPRLSLDFENHVIESTTPVRAHPRVVTPDFFTTMGIPLLRGRQFNERDNASAPDVVIVNDAAVRRYWAGENPVGQRINLGSPTRWMEIVGVVGDIRHQSLDAQTEPEAYMPQRQNFSSLGPGLARDLTVVIRTTGDLASTAAAVRAAVAELDPQQPVSEIRPLDAIIAESVAPRRFNFLLLAAFALTAVVLTAAGLYGVMSYLVLQRTREIGVRMALGATRRQVLALMFRQAGAMTAIGIVSGIGGALVLSRSMTSMLYGVEGSDPLVYVAVSLLVAAVALVAVAGPSARATRVDPLKALRDS